MDIVNIISGLVNLRNRLRAKTAAMGLTDNTAKLDVITTAVESIVDRGTVNANVKEGESYTLLPGYWRGGTVNGIAGGGTYNLQTKRVTPSSAKQTIVPDAEYFGLSSVEVEEIPSNLKDVSAVNASAADVLTGKVFVLADGTTTAGTMSNRGAIDASIDGLTEIEYTIPAGYHNGLGKVSLSNAIETALAAI